MRLPLPRWTWSCHSELRWTTPQGLSAHSLARVQPITVSDTTADIRALTDFSRKRAPWLRALNFFGQPFERFIQLDEAGLLEAARHHTGLSDFGPNDFRGPLAASRDATA